MIPSPRRALAIILVLLAGPPSMARAQIVNVQTRFSELVEDGVSASFDASADWRTGNIDLLVLGGQASVQYGLGAQQLMGSLRGELTLGESIEDGRRTFEHIRYRYWFANRWSIESFAQHEFDPQRRYRVRLLLGLGPRWVPIHEEPRSLALGLALMGERIEISEGLQEDSGQRSSFLRASSYIIGRISLGDALSLTQSFYVQPRVMVPRDFRLLAETGLMIPLTEIVALNFAFIAAMQSRPPEDVAPLDTRLLSQITIRL